MGDTAWKARFISPEDIPQQRLKGELQAKAFAAVGLDGWVPGEADFALGRDWVEGLVREHAMPALAANLTCGGQRPFPASRVVSRGGVTLGLVGVLGADLEIDGCEISDPVAAVRDALPSLAGAELVVVLSHQALDADQAVAEAVPEVDLVVNGHARATHQAPIGLPGDALQLAAGSRGKTVGLATVTLVPGASGFRAEGRVEEVADRLDRYRERLVTAHAQISAATTDAARERAEKRVVFYESEVSKLEAELAQATAAPVGLHHGLENEIVGLDADIADHPATAALMTEAKAAIAAAEADSSAVASELSGPFVGGTACVACHQGPAAQWRETGHAKAWASLLGSGRAMDRDCYSCHATGAFHPEGPQSPSQVGKLATVQCEACHGPGREHVTAPAPGQMVRSPSVEVCTTCHDGERDEGRFELEPYMSRVTHAEASPPVER